MVKRRFFKKVAKEKGAGSEARILHILLGSESDWPGWLKTIRPATEEEDKTGCDIVAGTDVGKLYLQVKSSWTGVDHFNNRRRSKLISTIVSRPLDEPEKLFKIAIRKLSDMRDQVRKIRGWS